MAMTIAANATETADLLMLTAPWFLPVKYSKYYLLLPLYNETC